MVSLTFKLIAILFLLLGGLFLLLLHSHQEAEAKQQKPKLKYEERNELFGSVLARGLQAGQMMQSRFVLLTDKGKHSLSQETAFGLRDTAGTGGKIRFDRGLKTGQAHVNIDPRGYSSRKNPHVPMPRAIVEMMGGLHKTLQYGSKALAAVALLGDAWRLSSALQEDAEVRQYLEKDLKKETETIAKMESLFYFGLDEDDYKWHLRYRDWLNKWLTMAPKNSVKTGASIVGGWTAGMVGGSAGAWLGAKTGAALGWIAGPPGIVVGSAIGSIVGALGGGITAGNAGSEMAAKVADQYYQEMEDELMKLFPD